MIKNFYKKHTSVPIREWNNNHYSFNKNNEKYYLSALNISNVVMKDYLSLTNKERTTKSKRMRDLMQRSSPARIYNSKGEIKQNGDKVNITIYTFDKEKSFTAKSLYSVNKYLAKYKKLNNITFRKLNEINSKNKIKFLRPNNTNLTNVDKLMSLINTDQKGKLNKKSTITRENNLNYLDSYSKNMNFYYKNYKQTLVNTQIHKTLPLKRTTFFKKKKLMLQNKKWSLYNKVINNLSWSFKNNKIMKYKIVLTRLFYLSILEKFNLQLNLDKGQNCLYIISNGLNLENKEYLPFWSKVKLPYRFGLNNTDKNLNNYKWERVYYINKVLKIVIIRILKLWEINNLIENPNSKIDSFSMLYKEFIKNNINKLFSAYFTRQQQMINNIYKSFITNDKYTYLTSSLKHLLNKLYNKKVNLNITNLKYSHLNADIFADAMVRKLVSKKSNIKTVIRKGLKLIKLTKLSPTIETKYRNIKNTNFYSLVNSMYYKINSVKDYKTNQLSNNNSLTKYINYQNKTKEIVGNLKHKWTTGVRLEGKGRLTSRYAASRAMYKYKTKGNLRSKLVLTNKDYSNIVKKKIINSIPSIILFRGIHTPNIQYTKKSGFKRIGAFGVKVWINNN